MCCRTYTQSACAITPAPNQWTSGFAGGICFTFGCAVPLPRTSAQLKLSDLQVKKRQRHRSEREVGHANLTRQYLMSADVDEVGLCIAFSLAIG